jgi:hypothetical protein
VRTSYIKGVRHLLEQWTVHKLICTSATNTNYFHGKNELLHKMQDDGGATVSFIGWHIAEAKVSMEGYSQHNRIFLTIPRLLCYALSSFKKAVR